MRVLGSPKTGQLKAFLSALPTNVENTRSAAIPEVREMRNSLPTCALLLDLLSGSPPFHPRCALGVVSHCFFVLNVPHLHSVQKNVGARQEHVEQLHAALQSPMAPWRNKAIQTLRRMDLYAKIERRCQR